ncbi:MAG: CcmD family protein [Bacteroidetes bacterium]|nr:CcmD family protein [Bacteroidota bacterium]MBU1423746.1 CcmD family protein [Bacteroidota bacterium]
MEFLYQNSLYIVLFIVLICWFGIYGYLFSLDKKVTKLENKINKE